MKNANKKILFMCGNSGGYYYWGTKRDLKAYGSDRPMILNPKDVDIQDGRIRHRSVCRDEDEVDEWIEIVDLTQRRRK